MTHGFLNHCKKVCVHGVMPTPGEGDGT